MESCSNPVGAPEHSPAIPPTMQPVQPHVPAGRGASRFYVTAFVALLALVLAASAFYLPGTDLFLKHDGYPALRYFGYSQRAVHINCEVVIFGDSSALTGLDPAIIQQMTGLKTCNISEWWNVQVGPGTDAILNAYLRHNAPPRILLGFWTFEYPVNLPAHSTYKPEGLAYELHYGQHKDVFRYLVRHPRMATAFSLWTLQSLMDGIYDEVERGFHPAPDTRAQRDARAGQWPFPAPPQLGCWHVSDNRPRVFPQRRDEANAFRAKYASSQTTVIVDVAPLPDACVSPGKYPESYPGIFDNKFERLPIRFFNNNDVHFAPEGSRYISEEAGRQIFAIMQQHDRQATGTRGPQAQ